MIVVSAAAYHSGNLLDELAKDNGDRIAQSGLVPASVCADLTIQFCTVCSGGEVIIFVLLALQSYFKSVGQAINFEHIFSCEINKNAQRWITELLSELDLVTGCLFENAEDLRNAEAWCIQHKQRCKVRRVDLAIAGTSCKDFSKATTRKGGSILLQESTAGGSAQTFHGFMRYLMQHSVSMVLLENSDTLDDLVSGSSSLTDLKIMCSHLKAACYASQPILIDAQLYACAQERNRYYIVAIREIASSLFSLASTSTAEVFSKLRGFLALFQREAPCLTELLLDANDTVVEAELNRHVSLGAKTCDYNVGASISCFDGAGMRWGEGALPEGVLKSPWLTTLTAAQKNVLKFSLAEHANHIVLRDIGQSANRVRYSKMIGSKHVAFAQMPNQHVWVDLQGEEPRLMLGRESMLLQGYPIARVRSLVSKTPEHVLASIGGNMMAAPVALAILQSLFAVLPWTPPADAVHTNESDVDAAMAAFEDFINPSLTGPVANSTPEVKDNSKKKRRVIRADTRRRIRGKTADSLASGRVLGDGSEVSQIL